MTTSFGPQGPNYATTRPATRAQVSGGSDTWAKDCSAAGAKDGSILDASFFNIFIANMRSVVRAGGVPLDDGDDMLKSAIEAIITQKLTGVFTGDDGVRLDGTTFKLAVGAGSLPVLDSNTLSPASDLIGVFGKNAGEHSETTVYQAIKSVILPSSTGVEFNDANGTVTVKGITHTIDSSAPTTATLGDEWYHPATDRLFKYCSDGSSFFWREI